MVVDRVFWLDIDSPIMALDSFLILFELIVSCSQVPVVSSHFRVDLNSFAGEFDFFFKVTQLTNCLSFQVEEVTRFVFGSEVESLVAGL